MESDESESELDATDLEGLEDDLDDIDLANLSDEELAKRKAAWKPRQPKITDGYLARYQKLVTSGNTGAILKVPDID